MTWARLIATTTTALVALYGPIAPAQSVNQVLDPTIARCSSIAPEIIRNARSGRLKLRIDDISSRELSRIDRQASGDINRARREHDLTIERRVDQFWVTTVPRGEGGRPRFVRYDSDDPFAGNGSPTIQVRDRGVRLLCRDREFDVITGDVDLIIDVSRVGAAGIRGVNIRVILDE